MKAIILKISKYREKDLIYTAICEDRSISFKVKNGQDPKSPYVWMNNILTFTDIELIEGKYKYPVLKEAKIISSPLNGNDGFDYLSGIANLADITLNVVEEDERPILFDELESALASLRSVKDKLSCVAVYFARCLKKAGMEFVVDRCVRCGSKKDIVAFDMTEGGFVCRNCLDDTIERDLTPNQLKFVRYIFSVNDYFNEWDDRFTKEDKISVLMKMKRFMLDVNGADLQSFDCML